MVFSSDHHVLQWSTPSPTQSIDTVKAFGKVAPFNNHFLGDIEWTLRYSRKAFTHRIACVIDPDKPIEGSLSQPINASAVNDKLVYVFTGQGSQFSGMAADIYYGFPMVRAVIDQGCAYVEKHYDLQLLPLLIENNETNDSILQDTSMAQPSLFILAMGYLALLQESELSSDTLVGHSLGEFAAACHAGVWDYETALDVVCLRGRLMASVQPGAMLACQMSQDQLEQVFGDNWCQRIDLAAINSGTQLVLSVAESQLNWLLETLDIHAIRHTRLRTSHAYHSRAMDSILSKFSVVIEQSCPKVPRRTWYSNVTGEEIDAQSVITAEYWCDHLRQRVRFGDSVKNIVRDHPNALFLEIGAKPHLSPLISEVTHSVVSVVNDRVSSGKHQWLTTLAKIWVQGIEINWSIWLGSKGRKVPLPGIELAPRNYWAETSTATLSPESPELSSLNEQAQRKAISVRDLWSQVLGIKSEQLSNKDHFFALGGSSVDLLDLVRQITSVDSTFTITDAYQCLLLGEMEEKVASRAQHQSSFNSIQESWIQPFELSRLSRQEQNRIIEQWQTRGESFGNLE